MYWSTFTCTMEVRRWQTQRQMCGSAMNRVRVVSPRTSDEEGTRLRASRSYYIEGLVRRRRKWVLLGEMG